MPTALGMGVLPTYCLSFCVQAAISQTTITAWHILEVLVRSDLGGNTF